MHQTSSSRSKRIALIMGCLFLILGTLSSVGIWNAYWTDTEIERNGHRAGGHVTKKEILVVANGDSDYIVDYWFVLPSGEKVEVSRGVSKHLWASLERGGTFQVLYSSANPHRSFPLGGGVTSVGLTMFISAFAAAFAVFGALLVRGAVRMRGN